MPLRVAVIGPKGQCGSCVVEELLSRGHTVVGISRKPPAQLHDKNERYSGLAVDIYDHQGLVDAMSDNFDGIVSAFSPPLNDLNTVYHGVVEGQMRIKNALLESTHSGPFIIVGGAGSLFNEDGVQLVDEKDFPFQHWYDWPDQHLFYMKERAIAHGSRFIVIVVSLFRWSRNTIESKSLFSKPLKPIAWLILSRLKPFFLSGPGKSLIEGCRVALSFYTGVTEKPWSFLSPPWLLRDQGVRTGQYSLTLDKIPIDDKGNALGIYNEDMAVAIVDEVENNRLNHKHWSCSGPIGLGKW
ncbi:hypothetical protein CEP54_015987 [Fusarium duplospermum]|uniref:NAD-dependent epimerase/dehydratase domain-containing protein n=1 Tax=Fusarium duplospermum TaxID=1325734 RepID=A0A428NJ94_9HYPO|nr:hypothetical protein CEP54_015987 [Fusarium duplospermum]